MTTVSLQSEVEKNRRSIKHEIVSVSLSELTNMYNAPNPEILIKPNFQRLFRWSRQQQSDFIESLILEIPIPPLFFFENESGVWELLDGLQRISTIVRFLAVSTVVPDAAGGPSHNDEEWHYENVHNLKAPLQLLRGDYLTQLEGLSFATLPGPLQLNLKRARLQVYVLKRETDPMYKYEVFRRLNRGGAIISDQEVRNCSARILNDGFPDFLQRIALFPEFVAATSLSDEQVLRGNTEELVLRYLAVKNHRDTFKHEFAEFLTDYMEQVTRGSIILDQNGEEILFKRVWCAVEAACKDGEAFKGKTEDNRSQGPFSAVLYEMVSIGVAENIALVETLSPPILRGKIYELIKQAKNQGFTGGGSNSRRRLLDRVDLAIDWFSK